MLYEVIKFYNNAESDSEQYKNLTIDEYLKEKIFLNILNITTYIPWRQVFGHLQ